LTPITVDKEIVMSEKLGIVELGTASVETRTTFTPNGNDGLANHHN